MIALALPSLYSRTFFGRKCPLALGRKACSFSLMASHRGPRVKLGGVSGVQAAPARPQVFGGVRKREPVTAEDVRDY